MDRPDPSVTPVRAQPRCDAVTLSLGAIGLVSGIAALVGLPLYGDGTLYYFRLVMDGVPEIPNLRLGAVLPQLPALVAARLSEDLTLPRHLFSLAYAALPVLSLLLCWLVVRRSAPVLVLFPALFLVANLVNLSGVSELLTGLYLTWPFVPLAALYPHRRITWISGAALAPLLLLLHPLAFLLLFALATLAWLNARRHPGVGAHWRRLRAVLVAAGALRLLWTLAGANAYERGYQEITEAAYYLMADTATKSLLLVLVLTLGLLLALALDQQARGWARWAGRGLGLGFLLVPLVAMVLGGEFLAGGGIKLKVGAVYPLGLLLMGLTVATAGVAEGDAQSAGGVPGRGHRALPCGSWLCACALAMVLVTSAKSAAWWTATRGLINTTASSELACIHLGPEEPYGLQWPWMAIVDNWTAPMAALIYRGPWPIPLLLPGDGCALLERTGLARLHPWIRYPRADLESRFGPLRPGSAGPAPGAPGWTGTSGLDPHPATQESQAEETERQDEDQDDAEGESQGDVAHTMEPVSEAVDHVEDRVRQ